MADAPDELTLERNRDLVGRRWWPYVRRALLVLVCVPLVLGLLNVFGQHPTSSDAASPDATLRVSSPTHARGGLMFQVRFRIDAVRELKDAILVLDPGWFEGLTTNTIEPSPVGEASRDGRVALELGHIRAGRRYLLFIQVQVNPTTVGRHSQRVDLFDGNRHLLTVRRHITIWP